MKTSTTKLEHITLFALAFLGMQCSGDQTTLPPDNPRKIVQTEGQVTTDDFDEFSGEIGVVYDARELARKGYFPTEVTLNTEATNGDFTQTVPIDNVTFMAQLKIPLENLSTEAKDELTNGVQVTPEFKGADGTVIYTGTPSIVSFQSNPSVRIIRATDLEPTTQAQTLTLGENTVYYIQRMDADGGQTDRAMRYLSGTTYGQVISANPTLFNGIENDRLFAFIPIPNEPNTFAIKLNSNGRFVHKSRIYQYGGAITHIAPNLSNETSFTNVQDSPEFKFKFEKQENGTYLIKSLDGSAIRQASEYGLTFDNSVGSNQSEVRYWRVVSTNVDWSITNIGTNFMEPILPRAETGFSFNSTLTNCGSGSLSQTVGANVTETRSRTIGWEEALTVSTSNTVDVSATVEVGFEAGFFGIGGNYNLSLTAGYSHSWSSTQTNTNWGDMTDNKVETLFSERTVTVPPGRASLVYDVYQFYPNTKVNFVQRLRVEGVDTVTGTNLTGEEIRTLFVFNEFNGVITTVEPNSIIITIKGTVTLDKVIKTESDVRDVPADCN